MSSSISNLTGLTEAGALTLIAEAAPKIAILYDVKASGTSGGNAGVAGTWVTRVLNTELDPDGIVSVSSNEFTLQAGRYEIMWTTPAKWVNSFKSRLYDATNSAVVGRYGSAGWESRTVGSTNSLSVGMTTLTIESATAYRIEMSVSYASNGEEFGNVGGQGAEEIYTQVVIRKYA